MDYYNDVYRKRLNRYGLDFQSRLQGQREREFDEYLMKSTCRVDFTYNSETQSGSLEFDKQDYTQASAFLLTQCALSMPSGTILQISSSGSTDTTPWMIWWLEEVAARGYNRYIVLKMTHQISWTVDSVTHTQWAYFYGPGKSRISETVKSGAKGVFYAENNNLSMFITKHDASIKNDVYLSITTDSSTQAYTVTELDIHSTPGVMYVSVDPTYTRSTTTNTISNGLDWLNGGTNGST